MHDNEVTQYPAYPYCLPDEPLPVISGSLEDLTLEHTLTDFVVNIYWRSVDGPNISTVNSFPVRSGRRFSPRG